jgi:hypothetical protein
MTRSFLLLLVCALLAGCGGGDDDGGPDGGSSKEAFVAKANEICAEGEKKIAEVADVDNQQPGSEAEVRKTVAEALEKTTEEYQPYLDRLRDLEPPEELADSWDRFMDRIEEAFDKIPQLADATRDNDSAKLQELAQDFSRIADETRPFAEENDLDDCLPDSSST